MTTEFDTRPAVRIVTGTVYSVYRTSKTALISAGDTKDYDISSKVPNGYSCVGYYNANFLQGSDKAFANAVFQRSAQGDMTTAAITTITVRNIGSTPIYGSYYTSKYYEQLTASLICVRSDLL